MTGKSVEVTSSVIHPGLFQQRNDTGASSVLQSNSAVLEKNLFCLIYASNNSIRLDSATSLPNRLALPSRSHHRSKFSSSLNDLDDHLIARPLIVGSLTLSFPDQFIISFVASLKARAPINCHSIGADSRSVTGKSFISNDD